MRGRFDPWVGKIRWRRKWQPTPVLLPGDPKDRGAWRPTVCGAAKELDTTWRLNNNAPGQDWVRSKPPGPPPESWPGAKQSRGESPRLASWHHKRRPPGTPSAEAHGHRGPEERCHRGALSPTSRAVPQADANTKPRQGSTSSSWTSKMSHR